MLSIIFICPDIAINLIYLSWNHWCIPKCGDRSWWHNITGSCVLSRRPALFHTHSLSVNERNSLQINLLKLPAFCALGSHWSLAQLPQWYCSNAYQHSSLLSNYGSRVGVCGFWLVEVCSSSCSSVADQARNVKAQPRTERIYMWLFWRICVNK